MTSLAASTSTNLPPIGKAESTLAWSDGRFNGRELPLRSCLFEARLSAFGLIPQYFGIDLQPIIAAILARFDTKVSPIPSSNCFVFQVLVLSPRRVRSHRARSARVLGCTDQPRKQDEVALRGDRAHRVCIRLSGI